MRNIIITGFMGTGKSEAGRIVAARLGLKLVDIDTLIEGEQNMTISEIFTQFGESAFREMEADAVRRLSEMNNLVVSTGGGVVLRDENMANLRKNGTIICLTASPEIILKRVGSDNSRPLLQTDDPLAAIRQLLKDRKKYYETADMVIDTEGRSPLEVAEEIIEGVKTWKR
jgi:shikimate kinase